METGSGGLGSEMVVVNTNVRSESSSSEEGPHGVAEKQHSPDTGDSRDPGLEKHYFPVFYFLP